MPNDKPEPLYDYRRESELVQLGDSYELEKHMMRGRPSRGQYHDMFTIARLVVECERNRRFR